jgi:phenylacetate-CoA ligase
MNDRLLAVYHRMPTPLRTALAGAYGLRLRTWRYGPETEALVEAALERDHWTPDQWQDWRDRRLAELLHRAATRVPYYARAWAERRRRGDRASWEYLENWPVLKKETLRAQSHAFVADDCDRRRMYHEQTSGTSGTPVHLWFTRSTVRQWYALFEARCRVWTGVSRADRWAILGGQMVLPAVRQRPPFWVWNAGLRQLYMSSYHLAPRWIPAYFDALRRYRVRYLLGYSSSIDALARAALDCGLTPPPFAAIITNAEPLLAGQREIIERVFRCPVRETYGMTELATAASECGAGTLHLWPDTGVLEVLNDDGHAGVAPGASGRFVCTGLLNPDMPLVRYEVGDRGTLAPDGRCACNRRLPALRAIEGRTDDVVRTVDGRRIGRLDPVFKADLRIREAQILQETLSRLRVRFVPDVHFSERQAAEIVERLRQRVGDVDVVLEPVERITRGANGKFRAVVSLLHAPPSFSRVHFDG